MKRYLIQHVTDAPDWPSLPVLRIDEHLWRAPVDISADARLAWDDRQLYVCMTCVERSIRAEHTGPLGMPCEDSCLEFFFCPIPGDTRYFNIEYNSNACLFLGFGRGRDRIRLLSQPDRFCPRVDRTENGWRVIYRIPFDFVRLFAPNFRPAHGLSIRANCYKCGDLTPTEHYLAWNPCSGDSPDFHRPQDFGEMIFL